MKGEKVNLRRSLTFILLRSNKIEIEDRKSIIHHNKD